MAKLRHPVADMTHAHLVPFPRILQVTLSFAVSSCRIITIRTWRCLLETLVPTHVADV